MKDTTAITGAAALSLAALALASASARTYDFWNAEVNGGIDERIEKYRKVDTSVGGFPAGAEVDVEQISHDFLFGAHIFNFDQLGRDDWNDRYKATYTNLFNAATVAFYWRDYESAEGQIRFADGPEDGAKFWNALSGLSAAEKAERSRTWRRPAPDPILMFCRDNGISVHGHAIVYGSAMPSWTTNLPPERLDAAIDRRIKALAEHCGDSVAQWDVVNESVCTLATTDAGKYGKVNFPPDYTFTSFRRAAACFPPGVRLAINDAGVIRKPYVPFVRDLIRRGAKIDIVGVQMHIFSRELVRKVADGQLCMPNLTDWAPQDQLAAFAMLDTLGRPLHISEVTIPAVDDTPEGRELQARLVRDNYRLWFSWPSVERITWWNVVDYTSGKELLPSGIYTSDMKPKPAYHVLDRLINHEWKTRLRLRADAEGRIAFRGFKGRYRLRWRDRSGRERMSETCIR